jgi:hypothetical protein
MKTTETVWRCEHGIQTSASAATIWRLFSDVPGWVNWNAGIEDIEMAGTFAVGTEFAMTPPGQDPFTSRLIDVQENELFVDETILGDLTVRVAHRIERNTECGCRVVYALEATGPGADEFGPMIASDFPEVLTALARLAESERAEAITDHAMMVPAVGN